jgi:hypothetical protein
MKKTVLVAGGTGNLGERIIRFLLNRGAEVSTLARQDSNPEKLDKLESLGVNVLKVNFSAPQQIADACKGISCVVSSLQGLHDVIVDAQKVLLEGAIAAGVPRFIPSDYSLDFTTLPAGDNRNFDLRREFHKFLDQAPISATSIFNGAFAEILTYNIPLLDFKNKTVGYWGDDPDWKMDFSTMDDTAAFTAAAALDSTPPRYLRIASFRISPNELAAFASKKSNSQFKIVKMGSLENFTAYLRKERAANPEGENEIFPGWQHGQYMHDMFCVHNETLDNDRYPGLTWTSAEQYLNPVL